jgi:UDP-N-acetylglucosamine 2-epimerase (non-hydrolysing)
VALVFGTRPEAIKLAPVLSEIARHPDELEPVIVAAGQHREMLDPVMDLFGIRPDHTLRLMRPDQDLFDLTSRGLVALRGVLSREDPDLVLVQGDTTTCLVGALASYYLKLPVGHVEAGLRTHDRFNPFPEEVNRRLVSTLADVHFAPTRQARANLLAEGVPDERVVVTGNTVVDALLTVARRPLPPLDGELAGLDASRRLILVTAHRRESFGRPMRDMFSALRALAIEHDGIEVVYPVHLNPNVRSQALSILSGLPRVHLVAPLPYDRFVGLMRRAYLILTDSGGIQEEAPSLGKPVLVMRDTTERPEGIESGTLRLVGTSADSIRRGVERLLFDPGEYGKMAAAVNPYGDGRAAERIVHWIRERTSGGRRVGVA